ncbi:MAG: hypothetical protein MAG795_01186 [Candidatus Woesearchaeota archaeon]|nr:hypothetical protein [Candidatus Woesearchaeota archaeon]
MNPKLVCLFFVFLLVGCSGRSKIGPADLDGFAKCLSDKGAVMYGTEWCSHCQNQKAEFGNSFKFVDFVDCDKQKDVCLRNNIKGYPTWIINEKAYTGEQPLAKLATITGCDLDVK